MIKKVLNHLKNKEAIFEEGGRRFVLLPSCCVDGAMALYVSEKITNGGGGVDSVDFGVDVTLSPVYYVAGGKLIEPRFCKPIEGLSRFSLSANEKEKFTTTTEILAKRVIDSVCNRIIGEMVNAPDKILVSDASQREKIESGSRDSIDRILQYGPTEFSVPRMEIDDVNALGLRYAVDPKQTEERLYSEKGGRYRSTVGVALFLCRCESRVFENAMENASPTLLRAKKIADVLGKARDDGFRSVRIVRRVGGKAIEEPCSVFTDMHISCGFFGGHFNVNDVEKIMYRKQVLFDAV